MLDSVILKVRQIIGDTSTSGKEIYFYENSAIFTLWENNIDPSSISVYKDDVLLDESGNWVYDDIRNKLTILSPLILGNKIEFYYSYKPNYSDNEITDYIKSALTYLSSYEYKDLVIDDNNIVEDKSGGISITKKEQNLVAIVASILIQPNFSAYRTPQFSFSFPRGVSKDEKIKDIINRIDSRLGEFDDITYG